MQLVRAGALRSRAGTVACVLALLAMVCAIIIVPAGRASAATVSPVVTSCVYANETGGTYKDNLCWLDMSYSNAAGQKVAITTEYTGTTATTCTRNFTCTTTMTYASVLGDPYGTATATATRTNAVEGIARTQSQTAATTNLASQLRLSAGRYYGNLTGLPVSVALSGGFYTLTAKIDLTAATGTPAQEVRGHGFPTWSNAFLGNNSFYVVPAAVRSSVFPALYQGPSNADAGTTTITLRDIQVLQGSTPFSGYSIVVADAESTDTGETITWTQTGGQGPRWLPNNPTAYADATTDAARQTAAVGNACSGTAATNWPESLVASNPITCSAIVNPAKTGTAMLQALPPANGAVFSVEQEMKGQGLQGVAFGVLTSRASVTVNVADRVLDANGAATTGNFTASVTGSGVTATANTGATALTATRSLELPMTASGAQLSFESSTAAPYASSYTVAWACTKRSGTGTSTWPAAGGTSATPPSSTDTWFLLQPNVFIDCTVTYTPPYLTLVKTVDNGTTGATNTPADFALTATGTSLASGSGSGKRTAVAVGSYALSESGPTNPWVHGYDWTGLTCTPAPGSVTSGWSLATSGGAVAGTISGGTLQIAAGNDVTCTYVNTARPATTLTLAADVTFGTAPATSWTLSATAGAPALPGPSGVTQAAGTTAIPVTPATSYQLTAAGGPAEYVATAWSCVDQGGAALTVDASNSVSLTSGQRAVCTVTYSIASLVILATVLDPAGTLTPADWTITATPAQLTGLTAASRVGADYNSAENAASALEVRPGHAYTLSQAQSTSSTVPYRIVRLERLTGVVGGTPQWTTVTDSVVTAPAAGETATYRYVYAAIPALVLPLTGGLGADAFTFGGIAVILVALFVGLMHHRRTQRSAR